MPEQKTIAETVKQIIAEMSCLPGEEAMVNTAPDKSLLEDLGFDSLDLVEVVMAIEEEFSIEIPDNDAGRFKTVGDIIRYVEERKK